MAAVSKGSYIFLIIMQLKHTNPMQNTNILWVLFSLFKFHKLNFEGLRAFINMIDSQMTQSFYASPNKSQIMLIAIHLSYGCILSV